MFLPLGPDFSPPASPCPFSRSVLATRRGNHLLGRANAAGYTLIAIVLATALGDGAARRGYCFQREKS
jgi:hypothetical protein